MSRSDMSVISFQAAAARRRSSRPVRPPAVLDTGIQDAARSQAADDAEDRLRMQQNMAALAAVAVLLLLGIWIIEGLQRYTHTLACIETGHHHCTVLNVSGLPPRQ
jgi:hypothetical protein